MDSQRLQEILMETACEEGADRVSKMDISERTKRVMLAESVENRIFQLQDDLDALLLNDDDVENGSDDVITLPEDETVRSLCVSIAREIKIAQQQYRELVSGDHSDMLAALESLGSLGTLTATTDAQDDAGVNDDSSSSGFE